MWIKWLQDIGDVKAMASEESSTVCVPSINASKFEEDTPWKAGDCGATAVTGFVIGAEEKGSSDGALNAFVIWEHRELMLSTSPSTSGTESKNTDSTGKRQLKSLKFPTFLFCHPQ